MPELPELEAVREVLERRTLNCAITGVRISPKGGPIVIRDLDNVGFTETVLNSRIVSVQRRGKFILLGMSSSDHFYLAINPKLTGRLQLVLPNERTLPKTHIVLSLSDGSELRYVDSKMMGQVYLTKELMRVPDWTHLGPEPYDLTRDLFAERLRHFQGEIKGILTRGRFVAGVGNAYADEILWAARIHPFRRRTTLEPEEVDRLYVGMQETLREATSRARQEMGESIHLKPRDFLKIHMKTGEPCPRCGTVISLVGANQRITNFCRHCQPGGLIKGL